MFWLLQPLQKGYLSGIIFFLVKQLKYLPLLVSLNEWTRTPNIQDVTVVADRAMIYETNLIAMEREKFKYTVAAKLRSLPKSMKENILFRQAEVQATVCRQGMKIQEHTYNGRRLIVSYSES